MGLSQRSANAQSPNGAADTAAAAPGHDALLLYRDGPPADGAAADARLKTELAAAPGDPVELLRRPAGVGPRRLKELARLELLLAAARQQAAALDEDGALASLAQAADLAAGLGDVPGAAGYNAEVQLQLGVTAAQAGLGELAGIALRRAATLDPDRRLAAGEARPEVVARAARIAREVASGPEGELRVEARYPGARVFVDDLDRGAVPATLRLPVGRHLLRVQAPGHVPYGAMIDVLQGVRPTIDVALAPDDALTAARALADAAARGEHAAISSSLAALQQAGIGLSRVYLVERSPGGARAIVVQCEAAGCRAPLRLTEKRAPGDPLLMPAAPLSQFDLARARRWLRASAAPAPAQQRATSGGVGGYLWIGAGAVVTALVTGAVLLAPEPERRLRVVVDPADIRESR